MKLDAICLNLWCVCACLRAPASLPEPGNVNDLREDGRHVSSFESAGSEKSKSELRKLNLQFEPSLREVADAKVMPKTDICQGGSSLRYGYGCKSDDACH